MKEECYKGLIDQKMYHAILSKKGIKHYVVLLYREKNHLFRLVVYKSDLTGFSIYPIPKDFTIEWLNLI